ncbi:MAG: hypothetical protein FJX59_09350 [Alphaproteobacteria bacterium]|nr:hypothetical protein [Alphaproteobacteria bacterium]
MAALLARYYRPPFIGIIALAAIMLGTPLAHTISVLVRDVVDQDQFVVFFIMGAVACAMLLIGTRKNDEVWGTLLGYVAGMLMWIGWVSYSFKFNEYSLGLGMVARDDTGGKLPFHLLFIQGSFGICVTTLLFFVFSKDSRCNAFRWIQRVFRLGVGEPDSGQGRNYCRITFLETVYITWFFYSFSLFLGDGRYLGYDHPITQGFVAFLALWGVYLLYRLAKYTRVMAAIRYAIPTKAIFWIPFGEFAPRYGFYDEVWLKPAEYSSTMWTVFGVFLVLLIASGFLPQRRQPETQQAAE